MSEQLESQDDRSQDRFTLIAMTMGGLFFGALFGAIFLPIIYGFLASFLDWNAKVPHLRWYCVLAGSLVGASRGFLGASKQIRRRCATRGVAEDLGMEYSADVSDELEDELVNLFGDSGSISISNAVHRNVDSARFVVADMRHHKSSGSDNNTKVTHQTIAFFASDQLQFPGFELQPEGIMLNLMGGVLGIQDINFDDYPEFSNQYHLAGTNSERIRQLFRAELLRHFTGSKGWQIKAAGNRLLMFRPGKQFDPKHLEEFIQESMETFSLFMAASYELQDSGALESVEPGASSVAEAPVVSGLLASLAESMKVSSDELEHFLAAPTPRQIPANILRQRVGSGSLVATILGCIFTAAGTILACVALFVMTGPMNEERTVVSILGTVFPIVGMTMAFFAIRYRRRNFRLLQHGMVAEGTIEAVERTDTSVNNQRQFRLKIRYSDGLDMRTSDCNIYGKVAEDAQRRKKDGQSVRVMYDRNTPQTILWADAFALAKF